MHRSSCPSSWEARREGERAFQRGEPEWSRPYRHTCSEADRYYRRGYEDQQVIREDEITNERRREERRAEEARQDRRRQAMWEEEAAQREAEAAYYDEMCAAAEAEWIAEEERFAIGEAARWSDDGGHAIEHIPQPPPAFEFDDIPF